MVRPRHWVLAAALLATAIPVSAASAASPSQRTWSADRIVARAGTYDVAVSISRPRHAPARRVVVAVENARPRTVAIQPSRSHRRTHVHVSTAVTDGTLDVHVTGDASGARVSRAWSPKVRTAARRRPARHTATPRRRRPPRLPRRPDLDAHAPRPRRRRPRRRPRHPHRPRRPLPPPLPLPPPHPCPAT